MSRHSAWFRHVEEAPLDPRAAEQAADLLRRLTRLGPPSDRDRRWLVEEARHQVARLLGAAAGEVIFTSGGTEAANLAIKGATAGRRDGPRILIASRVEALAVQHPVRSLTRQGMEVVWLPVDGEGVVAADALEGPLREGARLVTVQAANHEVGALQPVQSLAAAARAAGALFHTDAGAAAGLVPLDVERLGVDLLSLSGPRLGGLPGAGALWVRPGVRLLPQIEGGTQEGGLRAGAENLLGIVALGAAAAAAAGAENHRARRVRRQRDRLERGLLSAVKGMVVNGPPPERRLPGHLHASFPGAEGEALVLRLQRAGIEVSSGSSCASAAGKPSHVLEAMDLPPARSRCSLRFSLGPSSLPEEVDLALEQVPAAVAALRALGPGGG